jgi:heme-degrading monooxygenase HmoA
VTTRAGQPYTAGSWLVCAGREGDAADPLRFLSFGAWTDADAVTSWRGSDEFRERLGRCRALCEEFEGHDYTAAATQEQMQT